MPDVLKGVVDMAIEVLWYLFLFFVLLNPFVWLVGFLVACVGCKVLSR